MTERWARCHLIFDDEPSVVPIWLNLAGARAIEPIPKGGSWIFFDENHSYVVAESPADLLATALNVSGREVLETERAPLQVAA